MFARGAWTQVFNVAAKQGLSFAAAFDLGRSMGLPSYRRAVMLGDFNVFRGWAVTQSWFKYAPENRVMGKPYLAPAFESQKQAYMYRVEMKGLSTVTGDERTQVVTIHTDSAMTKADLEAAALDEYGSEYAAEVYALDVMDATAIGGFAK